VTSKESQEEINTKNMNALYQKLGSYASKNRREMKHLKVGRKVRFICANINLAMKKCNDMLELKIQKLEVEKTKILIENKCYRDKMKTYKANKIERKLFQKCLGTIVKN
jgi:hypothetical protein